MLETKRKRKIVFIAWFIFLLLVGVTISLSMLNTKFQEKEVFFVVDKKDNAITVIDRLKEENVIVSRIPCYLIVFFYSKIWGSEIYPGKYKITNNTSTWEIFRSLYTGKQYTIKIRINKFRLWKDFIGYLKKNLPLDSTEFVNSLLALSEQDTLRGDPSQLFSYIIPDTYYFFWTSSSSQVAQKLYSNYVRFWSAERLKKLNNLNLTTNELYIIASLVEEETQLKDDKPLIASVYINRHKKRMHLGSCPTIKYALKDFSLRRILYRHLKVKSPYNTYKNLGLPPGPICTPSVVTLDACLNAPSTSYLYFVASSEQYDKHLFSTTYKEHLAKSKKYINKIFAK